MKLMSRSWVAQLHVRWFAGKSLPLRRHHVAATRALPSSDVADVPLTRASMLSLRRSDAECPHATTKSSNIVPCQSNCDGRGQRLQHITTLVEVGHQTAEMAHCLRRSLHSCTGLLHLETLDEVVQIQHGCGWVVIDRHAKSCVPGGSQGPNHSGCNPSARAARSSAKVAFLPCASNTDKKSTRNRHGAKTSSQCPPCSQHVLHRWGMSGPTTSHLQLRRVLRRSRCRLVHHCHEHRAVGHDGPRLHSL